MVVQAGGLAVDVDGGETRGEERRQHRQRVEGHDRDQSGDQPGGHQIRDRVHRHRLDRVDLLGDPHRAQLRGGAGADGGRKRDAGDHRRHDAHIQECRQEAGERLDTDVAQRRVALHGDDAAGCQGHERGDADGAADHHQSAGAHGHLGDQPDGLLAVARHRVGDVAHRFAVEQCLLTDGVNGLRHATEDAAEADGGVVAHDRSRHLSLLSRRRSSRQHPDADGRHDHVDHEQADERVDDRLVDRIADALRAALDCQAAVAADQPGDNAEQQRLDLGEKQFGQAGQHREAVDERTGVDALQEHREDVAAGQPDQADQTVEQQRHERRGENAGNDEPLDRVDAQHAHRVDLFADGSRTEIRTDRGGACAGDHQHRHHGAELGDGAERGARAGQVGGADLPQQDVQRERHQHGERDGDQQRGHQRDARDHPRLIEELAELEGAAERLGERIEGHLDEPAYGPRRRRKLFDQPRLRSRARGREDGRSILRGELFENWSPSASPTPTAKRCS